MKISINDNLKAIQFWCSQEDLDNPNLELEIDKIYSHYKPDKKYRKIIYQSGTRNLEETTKGLLQHNFSL